ncbi:ketose-bisphosphate aldolase [Mariniflexile sp. HMF6888]|uniref:ketose-bisphosphate aldolase n=1 Tax=Mariniflexile sp. HMF6888 TaxID=3373086 RepID=UPI00378DFED1
MNLKDKLKLFTQKKRGLLATNCYNMETLHGVLKAASDLNEPLILQLTQSSIEYMGLETAVSLCRSGLKQYGVEGWLHLDHGGSIQLIQSCLDAGFDSVMIDASELPFKENIRITSEAVKIAEHYGAHVEAELGFVAKLGQTHINKGFTQPEEAKIFTEATGIDSLAIAIGTAHGFYKEEPHLDLELLSNIAALTPATLVLHGGSGVPSRQLQAAISRGICKVNLATEIKNIFMSSLKKTLSLNEEIDLRKEFPVATEQVTSLVKEKLIAVKNQPD